MLKILENLQVKDVYVYKAILCLSIGENVKINTKVEIPRFDLEIQSPFRFIQNEMILFGSYEKLFFENVYQINLLPLPLKIKMIKVKSFGDFFLKFEKDFCLQVFVDTRKECENWRLSDNLEEINNDVIFNYKEDFFAQKAQKYKDIERYLIRNQHSKK
ncbi:hypothetical protein BBW65_05665 [Helicobacter enhydrae]|uniref:Uncharacterized protein n=1 Tax=Helicobacter enhydrae TaxID=222136 RepID=A0A1B1U6F0_9HELI|nr:hypothetical protein [Helicobacter enhydrae]ANV98316.1 hypothetical protein BBW65_05665 [Helicobacter enhydrae]